jgi:hypothetical protein
VPERERDSIQQDGKLRFKVCPSIVILRNRRVSIVIVIYQRLFFKLRHAPLLSELDLDPALPRQTKPL